MESLYYFEFCVVIFSCCLKKKKKKKNRKKVFLVGLYLKTTGNLKTIQHWNINFVFLQLSQEMKAVFCNKLVSLIFILVPNMNNEPRDVDSGISGSNNYKEYRMLLTCLEPADLLYSLHASSERQHYIVYEVTLAVGSKLLDQIFHYFCFIYSTKSVFVRIKSFKAEPMSHLILAVDFVVGFALSRCLLAIF